MLTSCRKSIMQGLTDGGNLLILESPKLESHNRRLSALPKSGKVLSAPSAIFRAPAGIVSSGQRVSIGRPATSSIREDWRPLKCRGVLLGLPSFFNPEKLEVPHVPELY